MGVMNPMLHRNESEWSSEPQTQFEYPAGRKSAILWVFVVILAAVLGALLFYGYRVVRTQDLRITQIFGNQGALTTLGQRADAAENKLQGLTGGWENTRERVTKLETSLASNVRETRRYAESLTQQLHKQLSAEIDSRNSALDARLRAVESDQATQRELTAQLARNLNQDIAAARDESGRNLAGLREQEEADARGVDDLSRRLDRQRVNFEVGKGQTMELAPGISLQIRGVNVAHQRYHGSLSLKQDQRTVWLRDQSAQQPVRFFRLNGGEPYELVVTAVNKKVVAGYLLVPQKSEASAKLAGSQSQSVEPAPQ